MLEQYFDEDVHLFGSFFLAQKKTWNQVAAKGMEAHGFAKD